MYNQFSKSLQDAGSSIKLTPKQLIMKHIFDPTHIVTDDELNQLELGLKPFPGENANDLKKKQEEFFSS